MSFPLWGRGKRKEAKLVLLGGQGPTPGTAESAFLGSASASPLS